MMECKKYLKKFHSGMNDIVIQNPNLLINTRLRQHLFIVPDIKFIVLLMLTII